MSKFEFSTSKNQNELIEDYIEYLKSIDKEFGELFHKNIPILENFSEKSSTEKTKIRQAIVTEVLNLIDSGDIKK